MTDPPIELIQPSPTTNVPLVEVQSEDFDLESPTSHVHHPTRATQSYVRLTEPQIDREASVNPLR